VLWLVLAMCLAMLAVVAWPQIALWLPAKLGY
jgi:TRAP-type C4-dicarboxylate transport system permease large subunit